VHKVDASLAIAPLFAQTSVNGIKASKKSEHGVHILTVIARVTADKRWDNIPFKTEDIRGNFDLVAHNPDICNALAEYAQAWFVDASDENALEKKIEELQWMVTITYAAVEGEPTADFFLYASFELSFSMPC
jgi:hypothetical protein